MPPSPKVSKTRRSLGGVITGVTIVVIQVVKAVFFPQVDGSSVLHHATYLSFYMLLCFLYEKYLCA